MHCTSVGVIITSILMSLLSTLHADSLAIGYGDFGSGEGFIHLSNIICDGTEETLFDCGASPVGQHFCNHGEDAGVICEGISACMCQEQN